MTTNKDYRLRVATEGATQVDGNVDFTIFSHTGTPRIARPADNAGGQRPQVLEGRAESNNWGLRVVDVDEAFIDKIADSSGRANLDMRLADYSVRDNGGSWEKRATPRIRDIINDGDPTVWTITFADERLVERNTTIFEDGNTTKIIPAEPKGDFILESSERYPDGVRWRVHENANTSTKHEVRLTYSGVKFSNNFGHPDYGEEVRQKILDSLREFVVEGSGGRASLEGLQLTLNEFNHRELNSAVTFEVSRIGYQGKTQNDSGNTVPASSTHNNPLQAMEEGQPIPDGEVEHVGGIELWIDVSNSTFSFPRLTPMFGFVEGPNKEVSETLPRHIGGIEGIDDFELIRDIYDGKYQSTEGDEVANAVRYDSSHFSDYDSTNNPDGLIGNPRRLDSRTKGRFFRITEPKNMAEFVEGIYKQNGVVPYTNADGEIAPKTVLIPDEDLIPSASGLYEFNESNIDGSAHPTQRYTGARRITKTVIQQQRYNFKDWNNLHNLQDRGLDRISVSQTRFENESSTASVADFEEPYHLEMVGQRLDPDDATAPFLISDAILERFSGPPMESEWDGLAESRRSDTEPGDFVVMDFNTFADPASGSRGGAKQIMQIQERQTMRDDRPRFRTLNIASFNADSDVTLEAPNLTISSSNTVPRHEVEVDVSNVTDDAIYRVEMAYACSKPASDSSLWGLRHRGKQDETFTSAKHPSNRTLWARAYQSKSRFLISPYSSVDSSKLSDYDAPTGVSVADNTPSSPNKVISWSNGTDVLPTEVYIDVTSSQTRTRNKLLAPGSNEWTWYGGDLSDENVNSVRSASVRHLDPFGGVTDFSTETFQVDVSETTSGPSSPPPSGGGGPPDGPYGGGPEFY